MHPQEAYDEIDEMVDKFNTAEMRVVGGILRRVMRLEDRVEMLSNK